MLYRSEIIKVGPDKVDVRYVDYGNCDTVDVQNILEIPADICLFVRAACVGLTSCALLHFVCVLAMCITNHLSHRL